MPAEAGAGQPGLRRLATRLPRAAARVGWPLIDQGIASVGTFGLTIVLARSLALEAYGAFALLVGGLLLLHMVTASLLHYPLSIRRAAAGPQEGAALLGASLAGLAALCGPAALLLGLGLHLLGRPELFLPAAAYFVCWQVQETFRRSLFAQMRFAAAVPGDVVSYLGQVVIVLGLDRAGLLSPGSALLAMAATSGVAALHQAARAGLPAWPAAPAARAGDFWRLGRWSLANNLLGLLRVQILLWGLAMLAGATLAAELQAGINLVNLVNPLVIGLCNIIPQTAARALGGGIGQGAGGGMTGAWRAARPFALAGAPVLILFCLLLIAVPDLVLRVVYGAGSPYLGLALPVRLLALGALAAYAADMVCSYFHGVEAARLALLVNAAGTGAALAAAPALVTGYGIAGACLALGLSSLARLFAARWLLGRLLAGDGPPAGPPHGLPLRAAP